MTTSGRQTEPHQPLTFAALPEHTEKFLAGFMKGERPGLAEDVARFRHVEPRDPDREGGAEELGGVTFTHRFVRTLGDHGFVTYHVVEAGPADGEPVLLLHGIPDSWYQWRHVMARLAGRYRLIAPDLKGYGQSDKGPGDYTYAGVAAEIVRLLDVLGVDRFNLVTHDRGTVVGDHIAAAEWFRVLRYARGEQHLVRYHPSLSPQEKVFAQPEAMRDPVKFIVAVIGGAVEGGLPDDVMERTIQEYSYPGIADAVPRYFNSSTFVQEWLDRRTRLMAAWRAPILLIQGARSYAQPVELYDGVASFIPNVPSVELQLVDGGHFWPVECPEETATVVEAFLGGTPAFDAAAWAEELQA